jgi:peptidoglycan/xylan/chitin deacetylase (PgdA/CDA1 family)
MSVLLPAIFGAAHVAAGTVAYGVGAPRSSMFGRVVSRGRADANRVALTFDDGPTPGATDRILDVLREEGVTAAFFVVGANVEKSPDLLRRIRDEGHLVGNHSWHHDHLGMFRAAGYWRDELARTDEAIEGVVGVRPGLFRPPMGVKTPAIMGAARRAGKVVVAWSRRARDGKHPTTVERIRDRLITGVGSGEILLIHDGVEPNQPRDPAVSVEAVRPVIRGVRASGLEFGRLDALLGLAAYG